MPPSEVPNDERIQALEELCAHQAHEIDTLSDLVRVQGNEIELLKKAMLRFRDRLTEVEEAGGSPHENTKPPHY
ncbi:MAG: SlyX family protein [Ahrensia sp.]|nr:SlyX family protein [Ahrensia sp.]